MADPRHVVAGDVLEEKPRAAAGDVLEEKPRAAAGDVLEEEPCAATTTEVVQDVGSAAANLEKDVQAGDEEEEEAAPVLKRKLAKTWFKSPYDSNYNEEEEYEYNSRDDVEDGNQESFIEKEAHKIREKGKAAYLKRGKFRCPYCTTKPKPKDWLYQHLMSHAMVYQ
ncbi:hypothetical protein D1007_48211 [Hordeum vulgare]|nr:hypothetical protein D1007_48211 [Hordeum vulgare]